MFRAAALQLRQSSHSFFFLLQTLLLCVFYRKIRHYYLELAVFSIEFPWGTLLLNIYLASRICRQAAFVTAKWATQSKVVIYIRLNLRVAREGAEYQGAVEKFFSTLDLPCSSSGKLCERFKRGLGEKALCLYN